MVLVPYIGCQVCAGSNKRLGTRRLTKKEIGSQVCTTLPVLSLALIGENDKADCRVLLFCLTKKIDAAAIAQLNIKNHNRWLLFADNTTSLGNGVSLTDIFQAGHTSEPVSYTHLR